MIVEGFKLTDGKRVFLGGQGSQQEEGEQEDEQLQMIGLADLLKEENSQINYDGQQQQYVAYKSGKQRSGGDMGEKLILIQTSAFNVK